MTLEEALAAAVTEELVTPIHDVFLINPETRKINVPDSERLFGVRNDIGVERKHFKCPRVVGDGVDLSQHKIFVNYVASNSDGIYDGSEEIKSYWCEDLSTVGEYVTFSWKLSANVMEKAGYIVFAVYAKKADADGNLQTKWHTTIAIGSVLDTLPDGQNIEETHPDVVTQLLERMDVLEEGFIGASGTGNHSEVFNDYENNRASERFSHAEGENTTASGVASHVEGGSCIASGDYSHAEGCNHGGVSTKASGKGSHAEGMGTQALGEGSHAEGRRTTANGTDSHTEGRDTYARGNCSHAEGMECQANGGSAHAEGYKNIAGGDCAHVEGNTNQANGSSSHAEGIGNYANGAYQHVQGKYSQAADENEYAHIVGNGTSNTARSNAHTLDWNGNAEYQGDVIAKGCGGETPISLVALAERVETLQEQLKNLLSAYTT